nr:deoxyhypusine synthase family protein [Candidatus Sigynarchaeota archaeon]
MPETKPRDAKQGGTFDPSAITDVANAVASLQCCGSQGKGLGTALEILVQMVKAPSCFRVLAMSGAMIPAGMEEIVCQLLDRSIINAIVTTGANITHSLINILGSKEGDQAHYLCTGDEKDEELWNKSMYRIYDTLVAGKQFAAAGKILYTMLRDEFPDTKRLALTPSEMFGIIGKRLAKRCMLKIAADHGVPVFCGATSDSELGINLMKFREIHDFTILLDEVGDIGNFSSIISNHSDHGIIILGGGVPRNWAQQIFPYIFDLEDARGFQSRFRGYHYAVRFHTGVPDDGGCSGCTISENVSWGKYYEGTVHQSVWGDATITFPLVITALFQVLDKQSKI